MGSDGLGRAAWGVDMHSEGATGCRREGGRKELERLGDEAFDFMDDRDDEGRELSVGGEKGMMSFCGTAPAGMF